MEDINWNIMGDNKIPIKFTIPIKPRKKWWQFWKDESKEVRYKIKATDILDGVDGEYFFQDKPKQ